MQLLRVRDNPEYKYTLAFLGYGPEESSTVFELTYNYGKTTYDRGGAYAQVAISTQVGGGVAWVRWGGWCCGVMEAVSGGDLPNVHCCLGTHPLKRLLCPPTLRRMCTRRRCRCGRRGARWCGSRGRCRGLAPRSSRSRTQVRRWESLECGDSQRCPRHYSTHHSSLHSPVRPPPNTQRCRCRRRLEDCVCRCRGLQGRVAAAQGGVRRACVHVAAAAAATVAGSNCNFS